MNPAAFVPHGRTVPFEHGWAWIAQAWRVFSRAPGVWIGMVIALILIYVVVSLVPVAGMIATIVAGPVFTGGLMLASRTTDEGGEPQFSQLFAGFKDCFGALVGVGALYFAGMAAIVLLVVLATGTGVLAALQAQSPEAVMAAGASIAVALLIFLALLMPLLMALWFAPPLIVFNDMGAVAAMKASFFGCLRNMLPFLLYSVVLFIASLVASIPFGLGWLVLAPVFIASIYTGYRDIYFTA